MTKMGLRMRAFLSQTRHPSPWLSVLRLGEYMWQLLKGSSFNSKNPRPSIFRMVPFASAKVNFTSEKVLLRLDEPKTFDFFILASPITLANCFASAKLFLHLGKLLHLGEAIPSQCLWCRFYFLLFLPSYFLALLSRPAKLTQMRD